MFKTLSRMHKGERGITGLETAIIVIAFVVVAAVFAYTILSSGLFSSQKAEETVHSGVAQSQATSELRGSVLAYKGTANGSDCITKIQFTVGNALVDGREIDLTPPYYLDPNGSLTSPMLDDADDTWTAAGSTVVSIDSADYKEPPRSVKMVVDSGFASGTIAYEALSETFDLSIMNQLTVWVKSDEARVAGDLKLALKYGGYAGTTAATLDIPALATNTWKKCTLTISNPAATGMTSINCVALYSSVAGVAGSTIHLDALQSKFTESSPVTLVAYSDSNIVISEAAWTVDFSGGYEDDGDYLLEDAEKAVITLWLEDYNGSTGTWSNGTGDGDPFIDDNTNHLGANDVFSIQFMPSIGSTLLMEKRIPAYLDPVMRLN